jgi:hypothetical protein
MVMVVRAWVEEGPEPRFRARLIQAETPGVVPSGHANVVTTSIDQTLDAIRAWLEILGAGAGVSPEEDATR